MKTLFIKSVFCTLLGIMAVTCVQSQPGTKKNTPYDSLSLRDLLSVKIVSASKKAELLFDAPLSASVITKEEIRKAGCTSIMDALRLAPGMIVREQTNGNYDIQLRGVYTTPNASFDGAAVTSLVMIDNRPIFNYLKGSTFWESLPVDLNDVEKIEIIRGPAAALYGPNAVNGVINIITRQPVKEGLYVITNNRAGNHQTFINNASVGYRGNKWNMILSGNYQHRNRSQSSYFEFYRNEWLNNPEFFVSSLGDTVGNVNKIYPHPSLAMEKYAGNIFVNYNPTEKIQYNLSAGIQHSFVQKIFSEGGLCPITTTASDSRYADLRATIAGVSAQFSYIEGVQAPDHQPGNKYDFNTFDAVIGYNYTKGNFSLKPAISYRSAIYDDTKHADIINKTGMFNTRGQITTKSASLRGEYKLLENKLRLVAGFATSTFNYPDSTYLSYEFAVTYKLHKKHLLRAVYSTSPRSSTIYDTYIDQHINKFQTGYQKYMMLQFEGNKDLKLLTARMFEIGYRGTLAPGLMIDVELFDTHTSNYSMPTLNRTYTKLDGADTLEIIPLRPTNLPLIGTQHGITVSVIWNSKKIRINPFVTIQQSRVKNYAPFANTPDAAPGFLQSDPVHNNIYSGMGTEAPLESAPVVFGGASVNYAITPKLNINLNAYYYSDQTIYHSTNIIFNDGKHGIDHISAKLILNTTVDYQPVKKLHILCSVRNLLNDRSREFFRSDATPFMINGGINYEF